MKKAITVSGIIWGIFMLLLGVIFLFVFFGAQGGTGSLVDQMAQQYPQLTRQEIEALVNIAVTIYGVVAFYAIVAAIYSFVLVGLGRNTTMGKGGGIALGVVGIVLGATLPGIFFIIDSAKTR
jgi:hypothetical protein